MAWFFGVHEIASLSIAPVNLLRDFWSVVVFEQKAFALSAQWSLFAKPFCISSHNHKKNDDSSYWD